MKYFRVILSCLIIFTSCVFVSCKDNNGNKKDLINNHTVSFDTNGGSYITSVRVKTLVNPQTPTKTNYLFDGWYLDKYINNLAIFPLDVNYDLTLYAKWIKLTEKFYCKDFNIKMWFDGDPGVSFNIDLSDIELSKLSQKGYKISFNISYNVYYKKDYTLPIGYKGSPRYEVSILKGDLTAMIDENLPTTTTATYKKNTFNTNIGNIIGEKLYLCFSTNNIQNIIYFKNILVEIKCYK